MKLIISSISCALLLMGFQYPEKTETMTKKTEPNVVADADIYIDAPIEKVWETLAVDFGGIRKWASGVNHSEGSGEGQNGATCNERSCEIAAVGFNDTKERILVFDPENKILKYSLYHGLPGFVKDAVNVWTLKKEGNRTYVTAHTEMTATGFMGWMMRGMMRKNTKKVLDNMTEEVKFYIENGTPHPRKVKAMEKYEKKQAKKNA